MVNVIKVKFMRSTLNHSFRPNNITKKKHTYKRNVMARERNEWKWELTKLWNLMTLRPIWCVFFVLLLFFSLLIQNWFVFFSLRLVFTLFFPHLMYHVLDRHVMCSRYCCQSFTFCSAWFPSVWCTHSFWCLMPFFLKVNSLVCLYVIFFVRFCLSFPKKNCVFFFLVWFDFIIIYCWVLKFCCYFSAVLLLLVLLLLSFLLCCLHSCGKMKHWKNSFTYVFDGVNFYSTEKRIRSITIWQNMIHMQREKKQRE